MHSVVKSSLHELTWEPQTSDILGRAKQRAGQLYHCRSLLTEQDMCIIHKS